MDAGVRQILQTEEAAICIQLDYLLPELRKRKLVNDLDFRLLSDEKRMPDEKNRALLRLIETKGEKSFDLFVQALEADKQHSGHKHLAKELRKAKAAVTPPTPPPKPKVKRLPGIQEGHSQQQPMDSVYVSSQIKQMDMLLDENLTSQMNTMKVVRQLSVDIVHMQKDMNDMQQFLSSLIENQEVANEDNHRYCYIDDSTTNKENDHHYYYIDNSATKKDDEEDGRYCYIDNSARNKNEEEASVYDYAQVSTGYRIVHEELYKATFKRADTQSEHQQELQSASREKVYPTMPEGMSRMHQSEEKQFDVDQSKNQTTNGNTEAPSATSHPACSHSVSMHMTPIDGPCEINCNGELGGIYYLHNHELKLYFPPKCSKQSIKIIIHVYLSDKNPIKQGLQIGSAVFKFQSNVKVFDKAITLRIPHYIKINSDQDKQNMCFVIQRGNNEPDIRKDGHFPINKSHGSLKIMQFCKVYIARGDSKLHLDKDQDQTKFKVDVRDDQGQLFNQQNSNSCKGVEGQLIPPVNGFHQQNSQQFQNQQKAFGSFYGDSIKYQVLLALPLYRSQLMTSWCGAFYVFRNVASWKHDTIDSINKEDKINFPLEVFSREVDFVPLNNHNSIATTGRGVALKAENDPNAYWFVDPHPNKVEVQTVENLLDEVAIYSKEYTDYSFLIQHKNPPRSIIHVKKRQFAGECMELNCQLEVNGIKDIQHIDLIKTTDQSFKHEVLNEKTNQPSVVTAKPLPRYYASEPNMKLLHKYVFKHIAYKWDEIADILEFPITQKRLIGKTGKDDPAECCKRLFEDWLITDAGISPKTWGTLLEELDNNGSFDKSLEEIKRGLQEHYC